MASPILILGMHRSGTSALAGALEEAGLHLGPVSTWNLFNQKGNREHPQVMELHEQLLEANGGRWDDPPEDVRWSEPHLRRRDEIVESFAGRSPWGFKDPRTLFTLEGWRQAIPDPRLVGIFRHPMAVARSLEHRNRMPLEAGLRLWERYNGRLLSLQRATGFPLLGFDGDPWEVVQSFAAAARALELPRASSPLGFFEEGLRHARSGSERLPESVAQLYVELTRAASAPG